MKESAKTPDSQSQASNAPGQPPQKQQRSYLVECLMETTNRQRELEDEIAQLLSCKQDYELRIKSNTVQINQMEFDILKKKKEQKNIQKSQKIFLFELLRQGKDCR